MMQDDLKKKLVFPEEMVVTATRHGSSVQEHKKHLGSWAHCEDRLAIFHELKKAEYQDLIDEARLLLKDATEA